MHSAAGRRLSCGPTSKQNNVQTQFFECNKCWIMVVHCKAAGYVQACEHILLLKTLE